MASQSLTYAKSEVRKNPTRRQRHLDWRWFTAANYIRVFAAVLMRGLVNARDDPDFFGGIKHGPFESVGAEKVVGLTLNQYQQLLHYMHLVDNAKARAPSHDNFDKLFKVRPMITMLQSVFWRWCTPGKNNGMDEATIPSRHKWMRTFNPTKPSKYFMEILMTCDSETRFCWAFFVTESVKKTIHNRHRGGRNKGKFLRVCNNSHSSRDSSLLVYHNTQVPHYQYEYGPRERQVQLQFGSAPTQMIHFARLLRARYPSPVVYRIFVDRRWDSLPGVYYGRKEYNVSFTATVRMNAKYHVVAYWINVVKKSKKMSKRGKYRISTVNVDDITLNTCLWNDSSLLGGISTDLGCEDDPVTRRTGRHLPDVS